MTVDIIICSQEMYVYSFLSRHRLHHFISINIRETKQKTKNKKQKTKRVYNYIYSTWMKIVLSYTRRSCSIYENCISFFLSFLLRKSRSDIVNSQGLIYTSSHSSPSQRVWCIIKDCWISKSCCWMYKVIHSNKWGSSYSFRSDKLYWTF